MTLLDRVRRTIREHQLAGPSTRVVIALSGGSDSVALAHLLSELARAGELVLAGIAHFNHQLRPEADSDERFCAALAESLDLPFLAEREAVAVRAARDRTSIETTARTARHEFFERAARHFSADIVAIGHTRDDQAETFLLRLLRGAGARGLASMSPRRGLIARPLLDCRRAELRALLELRRLAWVDDASNEDLRIPRNRVRAELMPLLAGRFNPAIVDALAAQADLARAEWQWMNAEADRHAGEVCRREGAGWRIELAALATLPTALTRILIHRVLSEASGGRAGSFEHVEQVRRLAVGGQGPMDLPGCRVDRSAADIVLTGRHERGTGRVRQPEPNLFSYSLSIPGSVVVGEAGLTVSAELDSSEAVEAATGPSEAVVAVRLDQCGGRLTVRSRRPGDRFRPVGLGGRKKVQDFFVDRKVPRYRRDLVPIVTDAENRIVWVAGYALDEEHRVTDPAQAVLILRLKPAGGTE
jgi:tRNA(Ile)-lysidine synthase